MPVYLSYRENKDGTPYRLLLQDGPSSIKPKRVGGGIGRYSPKFMGWTYPFEPVLIREIVNLYSKDDNGVLKIDGKLKRYLELMRHEQDRILESKKKAGDGRAVKGLWKFQKPALNFLVNSSKSILALDMGLGKTVVSCAAIGLMGKEKVLIVCPDSVKWSWGEHLTRWSGVDNPIIQVSKGVSVSMESSMRSIIPHCKIHSGSKESRAKALSDIIRNPMVLILNYDQMKQMAPIIKRTDWEVIIFDEAHRLKNHRAKRSEDGYDISKKAEKVWLLTGTPLRRDFTDFFGLLKICDPIRFVGYWNFIDVFMETAENFATGRKEPVGLKNEEEFNRMLSPYMFVAKKEEVIPDLPPIIYKDTPVSMESSQFKQYKSMEKEFVMEVEKLIEKGESIESILRAPSVIAQKIRLRQICLTPAVVGGVRSSGKLEALGDLVGEYKEEKTQFLLFTFFKKFIPFMEGVLNDKGIKYGIITGDTSGLDRKKIEDSLMRGEIQCVIGTAQSMGEGMNLQAASVAVFTDRDYIPATNRQAEARIHRGVTKESPTVVILYHPNTVEVDVRRAAERILAKEGTTVGSIGKSEHKKAELFLLESTFRRLGKEMGM